MLITRLFDLTKFREIKITDDESIISRVYAEQFADFMNWSNWFHENIFQAKFIFKILVNIFEWLLRSKGLFLPFVKKNEKR